MPGPVAAAQVKWQIAFIHRYILQLQTLAICRLEDEDATLRWYTGNSGIRDFARVTCYALLYFDLSAVADIYLYAPPLRGTAFSFLTVLITFVSCVSLKLHKLSQMLI